MTAPAVLSDDRVSELVAAVQEGRVAQAAPTSSRKPRRVRNVDFKRPTKFTPEHVRRLTRAHEGFCAWLATRLGTEMRLPLDVEVINVVQLTWQHAHADIPVSSVCGTVECPDTGGAPMLLAAELPFTLFVVDRMLGGLPVFEPRERRLTDIDRALIRRFFTSLTEGLSIAWSEAAGMSLQLAGTDTHAGTAQAVVSSESVLALTTEIRFEGASATITLLVPWMTVEPAVHRLSADTASAADHMSAGGPGVGEALRTVDIPLMAEVGALDLPVEEVLALKSGDVLRLGVPAAKGVVLRAGDTAIAAAHPGRSGRRRAVQVTALLEER